MKFPKQSAAFLLLLALLLNLSGCYISTDYKAIASIVSLLQENLEKADAAHYVVGEEIVKDRPNFEIGTNRRLYDNIEVQIFFMDDDESGWTTEETNAFLSDQLIPAFDYIKEQAQRYDVTLSFKYVPYGNTYSKYYSMVYDGTVSPHLYLSLINQKTLDHAAQELGYENKEEMHQSLKFHDAYKEIIYLTVFNKAGVSYACNQQGSDFQSPSSKNTEYCVLFAEYNDEALEGISTRPSTIAYQLLQLYGAENLTKTPSRIFISEDYYPKDIMRGGDVENIKETEIDEYTAFSVGWLYSAPEVCYIKEFWKTDE